jgi:ERCC4-related helicase
MDRLFSLPIVIKVILCEMHDLLVNSTPELAHFLESKLPALSNDWWNKHVLQRLSFQQQRMVSERRINGLEQLDFAALLRVLDQNWHELANTVSLPREGRTWVKELQSIRNKWAHHSGQIVPPSETYRDADTLARFLSMIGASSVCMDEVERSRTLALHAMSALTASRGGPTSDSKAQPSNNVASQPSQTATPVAGPKSLFQVGDLVALRSNPATVVPVIEVVPGGAECRYRVFQNSTKVTYYESQLESPATRSNSRKSLKASELHAALTSIQLLSPSTTNLFSLRSGRVNFVPYQYRPVLKLIRSDRPRLLIADEVGVGKTIEAGLIIKELSARMDLSSVLVICPKALVAEHKWRKELKRFDEQFTELDGRLLRHCLEEVHLEGAWPEQYAKAILPFSLFDAELIFGGADRRAREEKGLLTLDPAPRFDLVIVDEAHHIRNSETYLHQGVRFFCDNANAVIFLSATPIQLGSKDLYTLLNVLRPDLIIDQASFEQMSEPNAYINAAVQACRRGQPNWQQATRDQLDGVAQSQWGRLFLAESTAFQAVYDRLGSDSLTDTDRVSLSQEIEDLYTFRGLINRTRRRDIGDFTTRKPETVTVEFTPNQRKLHDGILSIIEKIFVRCHGQQNVKFMMTTIRRQAASCLYGLAPLLQDILTGKLDRLELMEAADAAETEIDVTFVEQVRAEIGGLLELAAHLETNDPKVEAFKKVLRDKSKMPNNKALVFSTFRHTLGYLSTHTQMTGLRYGVIHGDIPDDERASLRRRFSLPSESLDAIDVLLSSEVGCEGLDFQFCDFLINYDLPWNPMRIEQRIGRIDRYGQKSETVAIINFITPGTVDADIYERCLIRIGVFEHAIGSNEEILGQITQELHDIAESFTLNAAEREQRLRQLADNSIRRVREEQELEAKQAELFGLNVPASRFKSEVEAADSFWLSPFAVQRCVETYLERRLGGETDHILGDKPLKTLRLNESARQSLLEDYRSLPRSLEPTHREWERFLKDSKPMTLVTFEQDTAAENPGAMHLTLTHPLVRQAARCVQLDEPAYVSLTVTSATVPSGEHRFVLYGWTKTGVREDETIVPVASNDAVERELLDLLRIARDSSHPTMPSETDLDTLDIKHHEKWSTARVNHMAENRLQVEHRIQSLTVSHLARCKAIEDQLARASDERIKLMKQSELARASVDFKRHLSELEKAASSGDIHSRALMFGVLTVQS